MVDSNFFFITVGMPNPDQYCSKCISKSKQASIVKTGLKCPFFKRYHNRKTTHILKYALFTTNSHKAIRLDSKKIEIKTG